MNKNNIGNRIKRFRKQKHLSVDKLSSITGISRATIYRYENGEIEKPPYTALVSLSKALDTTSDFLIGTNDDNYCTIKLTGDDWRSKLMCGCGCTIRLCVGKKTHFFNGVWVYYKLIRGWFSQ